MATTTERPTLDPLDYLATDALLDDEERAIRDTVREFVRARVLPDVGEWFEKGTFPQTQRLFFPVLCNQCDEAPCLTICPTGALSHRAMKSEEYVPMRKELGIDPGEDDARLTEVPVPENLAPEGARHRMGPTRAGHRGAPRGFGPAGRVRIPARLGLPRRGRLRSSRRVVQEECGVARGGSRP